MYDTEHSVYIVDSIVVNPIFSARSCNPGGILGLQNHQSESRDWKNWSGPAVCVYTGTG